MSGLLFKFYYEKIQYTGKIMINTFFSIIILLKATNLYATEITKNDNTIFDKKGLTINFGELAPDVDTNRWNQEKRDEFIVFTTNTKDPLSKNNEIVIARDSNHKIAGVKEVTRESIRYYLKDKIIIEHKLGAKYSLSIDYCTKFKNKFTKAKGCLNELENLTVKDQEITKSDTEIFKEIPTDFFAMPSSGINKNLDEIYSNCSTLMRYAPPVLTNDGLGSKNEQRPNYTTSK